jgi:hypothetical protein
MITSAMKKSVKIAIIVFLAASPALAQNAKGWFEEFCNGATFHLTKFAGQVGSPEIALWLETKIPFRLYPAGADWVEVQVCATGQPCDQTAKAKLQFQERRKHLLLGKYVVDLNGKHREGQFAIKQQQHKEPQHLCM